MKMTLDEAIEYYIKVATDRELADEEMGVNDKWNETKFMTNKESEQIIADNRQLAEWLTELKEAKKLLKVAMKDMKILYESGRDEGCVGIEFKWRYTNEALKLIGDESNGI